MPSINSLGLRPALVIASVFSAAFAIPASAHDAPLGWKYPWSCCSNKDCRQMSGDGISERPDGYVVAATGEVIPYRDKRVKDSPDGEYHWCANQVGVDAGHTICLFVPPKGF